ncbi:acetoin utilization protein AcuA [Gracilibacillus ureilyticus]|uniref:Acetoin utilization protein AcuA n=1 Tax=Gracilibacillus ureilyticus TaxID=531814 RepID=A0A1H9TBY5_9BACI|nr:GNAT family N-acetyltransferase [Gracilibacillus ureilyticus]SER94830.1 acetoin utilization protein AcuA [Gracilibacillus ureilyticus]
MFHKKKALSKKADTTIGSILLTGPVPPEQLETLVMHDQLHAFRPPLKQLEALKEIAALEEGRIFIALHNETIIGYVTYLHPDPIERWSTFKMENLIELGAIEIAKEYRGLHLGSKLIELSVSDPFMENYIIISTEYYWHWDINETKLSVWDYRKIMEKMMNAGGLHPEPTNDPEIMAHPANCLMVRIGKNVSEEDRQLFDKLRFLND